MVNSQFFSKTFINHYMRKSPCNIVILILLTRDGSVKFSRMVAAGIIELTIPRSSHRQSKTAYCPQLQHRYRLHPRGADINSTATWCVHQSSIQVWTCGQPACHLAFSNEQQRQTWSRRRYLSSHSGWKRHGILSTPPSLLNHSKSALSAII